MTLPPIWTMWASSTAEISVLAALNFAVYAAIVFIVLCRARMPSSTIPRKRRAALFIGLSAAAVAAISHWLWDEKPGPGSIAAGLAWMAYLLTHKD